MISLPDLHDATLKGVNFGFGSRRGGRCDLPKMSSALPLGAQQFRKRGCD